MRVRSGVQSLRRLSMAGRNGRAVEVDLHAVPVVGPTARRMARRCCCTTPRPRPRWKSIARSLHEKATKDPLTQVANRAEFDRMQQQFVVRRT